jgi:hypothetical protein
MVLDQPATLNVFYEESKEPVRFKEVTNITESADGSLKIVYADQIVKIRPTYRYYTLDLGDDEDGESEPSGPW